MKDNELKDKLSQIDKGGKGAFSVILIFILCLSFIVYLLIPLYKQLFYLDLFIWITNFVVFCLVYFALNITMSLFYINNDDTLSFKKVLAYELSNLKLIILFAVIYIVFTAFLILIFHA